MEADDVEEYEAKVDSDNNDKCEAARIRTAAVNWWTVKTSVTGNTKNVVIIDGHEHPIHWLGGTIERFYKQFLESDPVYHYYNNQKLVHGDERVPPCAMRAVISLTKFTELRPIFVTKHKYKALEEPSLSPVIVLEPSEGPPHWVLQLNSPGGTVRTGTCYLHHPLLHYNYRCTLRTSQLHSTQCIPPPFLTPPYPYHTPLPNHPLHPTSPFNLCIHTVDPLYYPETM
jgi:hypothetical protein